MNDRQWKGFAREVARELRFSEVEFGQGKNGISGKASEPGYLWINEDQTKHQPLLYQHEKSFQSLVRYSIANIRSAVDISEKLDCRGRLSSNLEPKDFWSLIHLRTVQAHYPDTEERYRVLGDVVLSQWMSDEGHWDVGEASQVWNSHNLVEISAIESQEDVLDCGSSHLGELAHFAVRTFPHFLKGLEQLDL